MCWPIFHCDIRKSLRASILYENCVSSATASESLSDGLRFVTMESIETFRNEFRASFENGITKIEADFKKKLRKRT